MFKTINGFTKEKMIQMINERMFNKKCTTEDLRNKAVYKSPSGNRCAIGVFIPDNNAGEKFRGSVDKLLDAFPGLHRSMPLEIKGLTQLQELHDNGKYSTQQNPKPRLIRWIKENVES